jgi:tripartite ATP-independent transporter DctP family solute receptor
MQRLIAALGAVLVVGLGFARAPAAEVTLKLGHQNNPGHSIHEGAVRFAELVNEKTNGEVTIEVFPSAQLGGLNQLWTGIKIGSLEMAGSLVPAVGADLVPGLTVFDAPYAFKDLEHFHKVSRGPIAERLNEDLIEKAGVRILFYQTFGIRNLTANKAIYNPEDLAGMKVRAVTLPVFLATVEGLGATPTPLDFSEVYQGLRTGIVDGQENPVSTIHSAKLYEVQDYLMLTQHIFGIVAVMINEGVYQSLSPEAQAAMQEAALEAADYADGLAMKEEAELKEKLREAGMTIIGPDDGLDLEAFRTRVQESVYPKFAEQWGEILPEVQALAE